MKRHELTNEAIAALVPTISARPQHYYDLVRKLLTEGFSHRHETAEWHKTVTDGGLSGEVRGRICWTADRAWLRHPNTNEQSHVTVATA